MTWRHASESGHQTRTDESSEDEQSSSVGGDAECEDADEAGDGSDADAANTGDGGKYIQHSEVTQS